MGIQVILHGFIECPFDFGQHDKSRLVFEHNCGVIRSLPGTVADHPLISRLMLSVHPPEAVVPHYGANLITFGGSYKNMYSFENDWICGFEELLSKLCWHNASVFNEFGALRCDWHAEQAFERAFDDPPLPPVNWTVAAFQLSKQVIPLEQAVRSKSWCGQ